MDYRELPIDQWWKLVADAEPEQISKNSTVSMAVAQGPFSTGQLAVTASQPGRVDFSWLPVASPSPVRWPSVGDWPACIQAFVPKVAKWLPQYPSPIHRVAFGATVSSPVPDRSSGYRALESALDDIGLKLPGDLSDFLIQFNLPLASRSGPDGMVINRLARWGVAKLAPIFFQVGLSSPTPIFPQIAEVSAVRIELDFNTPAEWLQAISIDHGRDLLREMPQMSIDYLAERLQ
jgi:hypothetical protein